MILINKHCWGNKDLSNMPKENNNGMSIFTSQVESWFPVQDGRLNRYIDDPSLQRSNRNGNILCEKKRANLEQPQEEGVVLTKQGSEWFLEQRKRVKWYKRTGAAGGTDGSQERAEDEAAAAGEPFSAAQLQGSSGLSVRAGRGQKSADPSKDCVQGSRSAQPCPPPTSSTPTWVTWLEAGACSPRLKPQNRSVGKLNNMPGMAADTTEVVASYLIH